MLHPSCIFGGRKGLDIHGCHQNISCRKLDNQSCSRSGVARIRWLMLEGKVKSIEGEGTMAIAFLQLLKKCFFSFL